MAKKIVAAKTVKPAKVAQVAKPKYSLVSFSVSAVIPTQQYGNIQPRIEITAPDMESARAVVMPMIEDLYKTYAEMPLNGREPKFYGKVTETVKDVAPLAPAMLALTVGPAPSPMTFKGEVAPTANVEATAAPAKPKPEPVAKAEKAIALATSADAVIAIEEQIQKSVKIAPEDKPALITLCLKRRGDFKA